MDMTKDYYAILGVLPAAEGAVVKAAYRALAQRYHPDRFEGSEEEATERMMELNEAHAVLSDPASRRAYDQARQNRTQSADSCLDETDVRPPPGRDPLKEDWTLATQYYPDLVVLDRTLSRFSWRLANTYRARLLESKDFENRVEEAERLESAFLETYFGCNDTVVKFARDLIMDGNRSAARALNKAVRVLGSDLDSKRVVRNICEKFNLPPPKNRRQDSEQPDPYDISNAIYLRASFSILLLFLLVLGLGFFTSL